jgi:predicted flap endonuclease-1-like 5' DNA nuclease
MRCTSTFVRLSKPEPQTGTEVKAMDKEGFRKFLKKKGRSERVTDAAIARVEEFERYLKKERGGKDLDVAKPDDLDAFISWVEKDEDLAAKKYLLGISRFYEYVPNEQLSDMASFRWNERMASSAAPFRLKEFRGISPADLKKLENAEIRNVSEMIEAGRTPAKRKELSAKTGVPVAIVLELVKLSDLARIQGVKGIRARLYYDAGVDTLEKLAEWNSQELRMMLTRFVEKTGFEGMAPLPKEVYNAVQIAKRFPKIVEY